MKSIFNSLLISIGMLSRIPVPNPAPRVNNEDELMRSLAFFPLVGFAYGFVLYSAWLIMGRLSADMEITALSLLLVPYLLNGFFHFDGLCDTADAFLADRDPSGRLEIMEDSRIGSFALAVGCIYLIAKFVMLKKISGSQETAALLLAVPVFSRYSMVLVSAFSSYPKKSGLGAAMIGRTSPAILTSSTMICIAAAGAPLYFTAGYASTVESLAAFICLTLAASICIILISRKKIGGATGDVLGAACETVELILYAAVAFPAAVA